MKGFLLCSFPIDLVENDERRRSRHSTAINAFLRLMVILNHFDYRNTPRFIIHFLYYRWEFVLWFFFFIILSSFFSSWGNKTTANNRTVKMNMNRENKMFLQTFLVDREIQIEGKYEREKCINNFLDFFLE